MYKSGIDFWGQNGLRPNLAKKNLVHLWLNLAKNFFILYESKIGKKDHPIDFKNILN